MFVLHKPGVDIEYKFEDEIVIRLKNNLMKHSEVVLV